MNDDNRYKAPDSLISIEINQENRQPYPKYLALKYAIFGSLIGGCLISIYLRIMHEELIGELTLIYFSTMIIIGSLIIGFLPYFVTGFIIARHKMQINTLIDYLKIGMIGFICVALLILMFLLVIVSERERINYSFFLTTGLIRIFLASLSAAISAMIMAKLLLPKGYNKKSMK